MKRYRGHFGIHIAFFGLKKNNMDAGIAIVSMPRSALSPRDMGGWVLLIGIGGRAYYYNIDKVNDSAHESQGETPPEPYSCFVCGTACSFVVAAAPASVHLGGVYYGRYAEGQTAENRA